MTRVGTLVATGAALALAMAMTACHYDARDADDRPVPACKRSNELCKQGLAACAWDPWCAVGRAWRCYGQWTECHRQCQAWADAQRRKTWEVCP